MNISMPAQQKTKSFFYALCALVCLAYAGMKITFYDAFKQIEPLLFVVVIYFFIFAKEERKSLPTLMLFVAAAYSGISWYIGHLTYPELFYKRPEIHQLTRFFIFLVIAFFLNGNSKRVFIMLTVASISLLLTPWVLGGGTTELKLGLQGHRIDFNIQNAQHTAMLFGSVLIGSLVFIKRAFKNKSHVPLVFLIVLILASSAAVYMTQTRAITLALAIALLSYIVLSMKDSTAKSKLSVIMIGLVLIIALAYIGQKSIVKITSEESRISSLWNGDIKSIGNTSVGARANSWVAGWQWLKKSPLIGWGSRGGEVVAENTEWLKGTYSSSFGHMHSSYVEMLVRYGGLGFLIFTTLAIWIALNLWKAYKNDVVPKDIFFFLALFFVYWSVINLFESYFFYWTGSYLISIVTAIAVSYIWKYQHTIKRESICHES